ncbi:hypothetical protein ACSSZE_14790 [Acidithiobacillus caldus]
MKTHEELTEAFLQGKRLFLDGTEVFGISIHDHQSCPTLIGDRVADVDPSAKYIMYNIRFRGQLVEVLEPLEDFLRDVEVK